MSEDKKPFAVKDRRHFTVEGEARQPGEAPDESGHPEAASTAAETPIGPEETSALPGPPPASQKALDFTGLLLSLGAQASLLLGGDPSHDIPADLEGARALIALLEVLKEKTEGRRSEEEEEVLEGILYELRMAFVTRKGKA